MSLEALLTFGGFFHIAYMVFHLLFWKLFRWKEQLAKLHPINQGAMQAMNIVLIAIFMLFALVSLFFQDELLNSKLGHFLITSIAIIWLIRTCIQIPLFTLKATASKVFFITTLTGAGIYSYIALLLNIKA